MLLMVKALVQRQLSNALVLSINVGEDAKSETVLPARGVFVALAGSNPTAARLSDAGASRAIGTGPNWWRLYQLSQQVERLQHHFVV